MYCSNCNHHTSVAFVAIADYCTTCGACPFPEKSNCTI